MWVYTQMWKFTKEITSMNIILNINTSTCHVKHQNTYITRLLKDATLVKRGL